MINLFEKMSIDEYFDYLEFLLFTFVYSIFFYIEDLIKYIL